MLFCSSEVVSNALEGLLHFKLGKFLTVDEADESNKLDNLDNLNADKKFTLLKSIRKLLRSMVMLISLLRVDSRKEISPQQW